jgi:hypothetical protein
MTEEEIQKLVAQLAAPLAAQIVASMKSRPATQSKSSPKNRMERKAMAAFKRCGGALTRSELIRATRVSAADLDVFVAGLCLEGRAIVQEDERDGRGTRAAIIRLV